MYHKLLDRKDKALPVRERLALLSEIDPAVAKNLRKMLDFEGDVEHGWLRQCIRPDMLLPKA